MLTRPPVHRAGAGRLLVAAVVGGLAVVALSGGLRDLLPSFANPFREETVDRTQPTLLRALEDLSEYRAAQGTFQVVIDVEDDTRFIPSVIKGERTTFLATGTVAASVDFASLDGRAVTVSEDGTTVRVALPRAVLSDPTVDPEGSYVLDRDRGILDRVGSAISEDMSSERELYLLAEDELEAAAAEADLVARAEENTVDMLESLIGSLGYDRVLVTFADDPRT